MPSSSEPATTGWRPPRTWRPYAELAARVRGTPDEAFVAAYALNLRRALVDWMLLTPSDIEARVGLTDGNIRHLDTVPAQLFARRPLPRPGALPDAAPRALPLRRGDAPGRRGHGGARPQCRPGDPGRPAPRRRGRRLTADLVHPGEIPSTGHVAGDGGGPSRSRQDTVASQPRSVRAISSRTLRKISSRSVSLPVAWDGSSKLQWSRVV